MEILFSIFVVAFMLTTTAALITATIFLALMVKDILGERY